jgi:LysR family transcriptional regulator, hydrogen peroxide-inducible genes activator
VSVSAPPFSLRQLQYAVAVGGAQGFRRAADECHISQPSLSAQIAVLEATLGLRLFERDRRGVVVTDAGREVLERARRLLVDASDLLEAARRRRNPLTGTVRIGVIPTVAPYLLPQAARALRASCPQLTVTWTEDRTGALALALAAGTLDAVVAALPLPAAAGDIDHAEIASDEFILAAPLDHPLGSTTAPLGPEALDGARVLLLDEGHCLREQALAVCSAVRVREAGFRATSLPTLVQMVAGGAGVTLLPRLALPLELSRADVRIRPFAEPAPRRTLVLAWRRRSYLAAAMREIAAAMRAAYPAATALSTQGIAAQPSPAERPASGRKRLGSRPAPRPASARAGRRR